MRKKCTSKEEIRAAALAIAVRDGIDKVSIRKLADACGIAVGSMYNYYPNKDVLIDEVADAFWSDIMRDQDKLYRPGVDFTHFLEQYYSFLYSRLQRYDRSWIAQMNSRPPRTDDALQLLWRVLDEDKRVNPAIWNMELNQEAFLKYIFVNLIALLQAGERNCRFFIYLLEHLLYDA